MNSKNHSNLFFNFLLIVSTITLISCDDTSGATGCPSDTKCSTLNSTSCIDNAVHTCQTDSSSCMVWTETTACESGYICSDGSCNLDSNCGNGEIDGAEVCDGSALGSENCETQGFGPGTLSCNETCDGFNTTQCGAGELCGNNTIDENEICDGNNMGTATCTTEGFYGGNLSCTTNCGSYDTSACTGSCGDGEINNNEACDGVNFGSASCDDFGTYGGNLTCTDQCTIDSSACTGSCGDNIVNGTEACDSLHLNNAVCEDFGFYQGDVSCNSDCTVNTDNCSEHCGDGTINGTETCEGSNFNGANCSDFGFYQGDLGCNISTCQIQTDGCSESCGDNIINNTEECDGPALGAGTCGDYGFYLGNLSCDSSCNYDTSTCSQYCGDGAKTDAEECDGSDFGTLTCSEYGFDSGNLSCDSNCNVTTNSCVVCVAGQYLCDGNEILICDGGTPGQWVSQSTPEICVATSSQRCNATTGNCEVVTNTGDSVVTGTFYAYASFTSSTGFLSGYDVGSYGNFLYVNRSGVYLDVYRVDIADTDGDGIIEPNQHPSYPVGDPNRGPMEARTLVHIVTYTKAGDNAPLSTASQTELYPTADRIYSLGPTRNGDITEWLFSNHSTNIVANSSVTQIFSLLGWGDVDGLWFAARESPRQIFSFHQASHRWVLEFQYPDLSGGHLDGLEAVTDPNTGIQYIYISDMTSNFVGQYRRDGNGGWVKENIFAYNETSGAQYVEGMGFGALNHFWITSGSTLYEIGGGDFTQYLQKK
jgi:hypothetical protein